MSGMESNADIPDYKISISSETIHAKPRKLRMNWSIDGGKRYNKSPLEELVESLDDPDYDPDSPESVAEWRDQHSRDPVADLRALWGIGDETLVARMADAFKAEIDREVQEALEIDNGETT